MSSLRRKSQLDSHHKWIPNLRVQLKCKCNRLKICPRFAFNKNWNRLFYEWEHPISFKDDCWRYAFGEASRNNWRTQKLTPFHKLLPQFSCELRSSIKIRVNLRNKSVAFVRFKQCLTLSWCLNDAQMHIWVCVIKLSHKKEHISPLQDDWSRHHLVRMQQGWVCGNCWIELKLASITNETHLLTQYWAHQRTSWDHLRTGNCSPVRIH